MTNPDYRAMCAELLLFSEEAGEICMNESLWPKSDPTCTLQQRARALLDQPLEDLADALEAPTLLERAMKGDVAAAKQFLHEAGFTDKQGYFLPQYQPRDNPHD